MPLTAGSRLGSYIVEAPIGAGGMGEVFRARDTRLGRAVAIKVLPDDVANEADRVARFEREAKSLAALNHPHIGTLFGMEQDAGRHFLVMELVDGETLADRVARGPVPASEALGIARQIAEALEAAHDRGIVHRDLKPANVKVTPDGVVKVLDFGLAKALEPPGAGPASNPSQSPTLSAMATQAGMILGTAAYMSPEQAKGLPADHRSDVFSFGCVLYELLTARRAFPGDSATDTLASVLAREPEWTALPPSLDPRLSSLVRRCLAKSRRERWQAIGDVRAEIEGIIAGPIAAPRSDRRPVWARVLPIVATAGLAAMAGAWIVWARTPAPSAPAVVRFQVSFGADPALFTNFNRQVLAVSADGSQIAYSADRLYVRRINEAAPQPIPGTDGFTSVTHPTFSPDGRALAFWSQTDRAFKQVTLGSATLTSLAQSEGGYGAQWSGEVLYFADLGRGIFRTSTNGGQPQTVVPVTGREEIYGPQLLPDGDTLIYTLGTRGMASWDRANIVAHSLKSGARRTLVEGATDGRYVASGHLLFGRAGVLYAVPLDLASLTIAGQPVAVVEGVRRAVPGTTGAMHYAVSQTGTLVYFQGPVTASGTSLQLALFDRTGSGEPLGIPLGPYNQPRLSPDGTRIAIGTDDGKDAQVWVYGLSKTSAARRLTFGGSNQYPTWSADGTRVTFQSNREGDAGLWWQRADGTDQAVRLTRAEAGARHMPNSWSPDGRHLLFDEVRGDRVSLVDLSVASGKATPFTAIDSDVPSDAVFSPDGRWVAYVVRPAGSGSQSILYVEPYPATGARYQISKEVEDGHHPMWSSTGRELFYTPGPGNRFLSTPISATPTFSFGETTAIPRIFVNAPPTARRTYDVTRDGRFLGLRSDVGANGQPIAPQIQVVLNWFEELKQRVPIR